jgi:DNA polymerase-3 subunit epsilon
VERLIVLDTETTGLDVDSGHKIIEIGCIEIIDRNITDNSFHKYINPQRLIDEKAYEVHGISNEDLKDKPIFDDIIDEFALYISDSPLIIHNAPFDLGFLKSEYVQSNHDEASLENSREIIDTLKIARKASPGKRNTLDALCSRYSVDNTDRSLHGALLDAQLLANVYLRMTQGQTLIKGLSEAHVDTNHDTNTIIENRKAKIIYADTQEIEEHEKYFNN